jgi:excisionase family DNA binding protein
MSSEQFSSFQIGKMLNVSRQAVNQWIDKGYILSYRTPGGHRRVRRADLMGFLRERNIPVPDILQKTLNNQVNEAQPRIMMIDDDEDFLVLMQQAILEQLPRAQVSLFSNAYDALVALGANPPDLLVLDLKMPNIDGLEVCRRLKSNQRTRALPILIVSAHESMQYRQTLNELGVTEVYPKSMSVLEIANRISDAVRTGISTSMR